VLCEETLETWHVYKMEGKGGLERIERIRTEHDCSFLRALVQERYSSQDLEREL